MRRLFVIFLLAVFTISAFAQEHLSFKGIPIEGSITTFCQKLKEKGLVQVRAENNIRMFVGDFTGREATIGVVADQTGKNVFSVVVFLPSSKEWKTLVKTYDYYKGLYTEKYGNASFKQEYNPSRTDSNVSLMLELNDGKVVYGSVFNAPGGTIELSIEKSDLLEGQVIIRYKDAQNIENKRKLDLEEI